MTDEARGGPGYRTMIPSIGTVPETTAIVIDRVATLGRVRS
jgi:hypothetical protein